MPIVLARMNLFCLTAIFWLVFVAIASIITMKSGGIALDTDAAMRLVEVRDLLAGQSWFDTTQWRMDVPFGLPMHWSRLVDAPIAGVILALRPLIGAHAAENVALWIWPEILFLAVLAALARIAERLDGRRAAAIVLFLALTAVEILGLFAPGAIHHHNVQIAITLWMLVFVIEDKAGLAAFALAASLAVGMETLPYILIVIFAIAVSWVRSGEARSARCFGFALAGSSILFLFTVAAARYRLAGACDTYSLFYAMPFVAGGLGLAALGVSWLGVWNCTLALAGLAVLVIALAATVEPSCFAGPYAQMDHRLGAIFLSRINEARPILSFARFAPSEFVAGYVYAFACLLASLVALRAIPRGWIVILFATVGLAVASVEVREMPFAIAFGLPGTAVLLSRFASRHGVAASVVALILASDASFAVAGTAIEGHGHAARIAAFEAQVACGSQTGIAPLAALPKGRVASFVDQGPAILAYSPDAVIAGPYHRDADGILDTYSIFTDTPAKAEAILRRRGIDYLMVCSTAPDWSFYRTAATDGLLARLAEGRVPTWLVPAGHDASGHVRVYRMIAD